MHLRCLAVGSVLLGATIAQGGATIQFVRTPTSGTAGCLQGTGPLPDGTYLQNDAVSVDVQLVQNAGGGDQRLRMVELDLATTSNLLTLALPTTHDKGTPAIGDDIQFWLFNSTTTCNTPSQCGLSHYIDANLAPGPVDTREKVLSMAYHSLAVSANEQLLLLGDGTPLTIGRMRVTMPAIPGDNNFNVVNAADLDPNRRARVDYSFDPHIIWRPGSAAPNDLGGGTFTFHVVPSCPTGCPGPATLASSIPPFTGVGVTIVPTNGVLWRNLRQVIRLSFTLQTNCPNLTVPTASEIEIVELLPAGAFGANLLPSTFQLSIEGGNTLRIRESSTTATVLQDNHWYAVRNTGAWAGVANFEAQFPVNVGDADGNRFTTPADVGQVNAAPNGAQPDQSRVDINGDGFKTPADVGLANANQGPPPPKPIGH